MKIELPFWKELAKSIGFVYNILCVNLQATKSARKNGLLSYNEGKE